MNETKLPRSLGLVVVILFALSSFGCSSGDDDDDTQPGSTDTTQPVPVDDCDELTEEQLDHTSYLANCAMPVEWYEELGYVAIGDPNCPTIVEEATATITISPSAGVDPGDLLDEALDAIDSLGSSFPDVVDTTELGADGTAFRVELNGPLPEPPFDDLAAIQGPGFSVDLNHLLWFAPASQNITLSPNESGRPGAPPEPAPAPAAAPTVNGNAQVLTPDSPMPLGPLTGTTPPTTFPGVWQNAIGSFLVEANTPKADYDVNGDGIVDDVHGHGPFVSWLLANRAPGTAVTLAPLRDAGEPDKPLMVFDEADLMATLHEAIGFDVDAENTYTTTHPFDIVNLSLGDYACHTGDAHRGLARDFSNLLHAVEGTSPPDPDVAEAVPGDFSLMFAAAAGNSGTTIPHFPAYFAATSGQDRFADRILDGVPTDPAATRNELRAIAELLEHHVVAVGALEAGTTQPEPACYSNHGWVDVWAPGSDQVSVFLPETGTGPPPRPPIVGGWASWDGTSFATPNFAAALSVLMASSPSQTAYQAWSMGPAPGAPSLASLGIVTDALSHPASCPPP